MKRVLAVAALGAAMVTGWTIPAFANPVPQPLVGVHQNGDGSVCVGISYQTPVCTPPAG